MSTIRLYSLLFIFFRVYIWDGTREVGVYHLVSLYQGPHPLLKNGADKSEFPSLAIT